MRNNVLLNKKELCFKMIEIKKNLLQFFLQKILLNILQFKFFSPFLNGPHLWSFMDLIGISFPV